jgi:hypothetical protein
MTRIGKPKISLEPPSLESRFAEYLNFAKSHKLVAVILFFWIVVSTAWSIYVTIKQLNVGELKQKASDQDLTIQNKNMEIQRLETLLTPFRTIALERYMEPEAEALTKLASEITKLREADQEKTQKINQLERELKKTKYMAAPPTLSLVQQKVEITKTDSGYTALLTFKPSKNTQLGQITLIAKVESGGKIVDFWPRVGPAFLTGEDSKKITEDGNKARLIFQLIGIGNPEVELKMSEASKVLISGSHDLKPLIIDIK